MHTNKAQQCKEGLPISIVFYSRQLLAIEDVQNALNSHGAMLKVLPHLSKPGDDIVREVLAFLAAMLFGGNKSVQVGKSHETHTLVRIVLARRGSWCHLDTQSCG